MESLEAFVEGQSWEKGPFTNDVSREGEGGGYSNADVVRGGCVILVLEIGPKC